ncbi:ParB family transcriptional regulator, chromosome partitioning protein [Burkholderia multivorans]
MAKPNVKALEASLTRHQPAAEMEAKMASTVFGQLAEQKAPPTEVPVDRVRVSPYWRRVKLDVEHVAELAASIETDGLLEPIIVRKLNDDWYEHIAGLHRLEAFKMLGFERIPARVRTMTDVEAARALTISNTQHQSLTDYERYHLHAVMLRERNAFRTKVDLASLLGCNHETVYFIDAFGELPQAALDMIAQRPEILSGGVALKLKKFAKDYAELVTQAVHLVAEGKLMQDAAAEWVEKKSNPAARQPAIERRGISIGEGERAVRIDIVGQEATLVGDLDYEKVWHLIAANLDALRPD